MNRNDNNNNNKNNNNNNKQNKKTTTTTTATPTHHGHNCSWFWLSLTITLGKLCNTLSLLVGSPPRRVHIRLTEKKTNKNTKRPKLASTWRIFLLMQRNSAILQYRTAIVNTLHLFMACGKLMAHCKPARWFFNCRVCRSIFVSSTVRSWTMSDASEKTFGPEAEIVTNDLWRKCVCQSLKSFRVEWIVGNNFDVGGELI